MDWFSPGVDCGVVNSSSKQGRSKNKSKRKWVANASPPIFELTALEKRVLFSFQPSISGPPSILVGQPYVLNLSSTGTLAPFSWAVNWDDGNGYVSVSPVNGTVTHTYASSVNSYQIKATAKSVSGGADVAAAPLALDTTFNATGKVFKDFSPGTNGTDASYATAVDKNGKIVVAGVYNGGDFVVARYNTDGTLDTDLTNGFGPTTTNSARLGYVDASFSGPSTEKAYAIVIQNDDKIVVAGTTNVNDISGTGTAGYDFAVARFNSDGTWDTAASTGFGTLSVGSRPGYATIDFGSGGVKSNDQVNAIAIDASGNIILAGSPGGFTNSFAVARLDKFGQTDGTFNNASGKRLITMSTSTNVATASCQDIVLENTMWGQKMVLGGYLLSAPLSSGASVTTDFALTRLNPDGGLDDGSGSDTSYNDQFGSGATPGFVLTDFSSTGSCSSSSPLSTDTDFTLTLQFDPTGQTSMKVVAAGSARPSGGALDFAVARYSIDGQLDPSFGTLVSGTSHTGKLTVDFGNGDDVAYASAIQTDNKILLAGSATGANGTGSDFGLVRLNFDGSLDGTFGTLGKLTTDFGPSGTAAATVSNDVARSVNVLPDGRIVAAGYAQTGSNQQIVIARYQPNNVASVSVVGGISSQLRVERFTESSNPITAPFDVSTAANIDYHSSVNPITGASTPFHTRWTGLLNIATGQGDSYAFKMPAVDGARLWIDGVRVNLGNGSVSTDVDLGWLGDNNEDGRVNAADTAQTTLFGHKSDGTSGNLWAYGDFASPALSYTPDGHVDANDDAAITAGGHTNGGSLAARSIDSTANRIVLGVGSHSIQLDYYQSESGSSAQLQLAKGTASTTFTTIPASQFQHENLAQVTAPTLISANTNQALTNLAIASFAPFGTNPNVVGSYRADINWGDGTAISQGTFVANASGGFDVQGSHTYASAMATKMSVAIISIPSLMWRNAGAAVSVGGFVAVAPDLGDPAADAPGMVALGADGGNPASTGYSGNVRYLDGTVNYSSTDVSAAEPGLISGLTRTWSNDPLLKGEANLGSGWSISQWPSLRSLPGANGNSIAMVSGGRTTRWFDKDPSSNFLEKSFGGDKLVVGGAGYLLTDSSGNQFNFFDTASGTAVARIGHLSSYKDAGGNVTNFTYSVDGTSLQKIERARVSDSVVLEQEIYSYVSGRLSGVVMNRLFNGSMQAVRNVAFDYYNGTIPGGRNGDLQRVRVQQGGVDVDRKLYRYDANGNLTYIVESASYERMVQDKFGGVSDNALTISDANVASQLAPYADYAYTYFSSGVNAGRVQTQTIKGTGGALSTLNGQGVLQYAYTAATGKNGVDGWTTKTAEAFPDGSTNTVYLNSFGEVLASQHTEPGGQQWNRAFRYDAQGRILIDAESSAVASIDESTPYASTFYGSTATNPGLIHEYQYFGAGSTSPGAAPGYLMSQGVQKGISATPITREAFQYSARPSGASGASIAFVVSKDTLYQDDAGTIPNVTSYAYTFMGGGSLDRIQSLTTTLPTLTVGHNGDGTTNVTTVAQFDAFGRATSVTDADLKVQRMTYEDSTGAVKQTIVDFGSGTNYLNLTTTYVRDGLGRATSITDARNNVTTVQFTDNADVKQVLTTPPTTGTLTTGAPAQVLRSDRRNGVVDTLTLANGGNQVRSLVRTQYNIAGQATASASFFFTSPLTYDTTHPANGISSLNSGSSYTTVYGYDVRGRQDKVVDPLGTITRTSYDGLNRTVGTWLGTNDANWKPAVTSHTNLVQISADQYDNGTTGDGNLTQVTLFPRYDAFGSVVARVSQTNYDWRDRAIFSMAGVGAPLGTHSPINGSTFDNLDRVVASKIYDGNGVSSVAAFAVAPNVGLQRAFSEALYDERGRAYQTKQHGINQTTGADAGSLVTNQYYDNRDHLIETRKPGGLVNKMTFDGAGRVIQQSTTDGGSGTAYANASLTTGDIVLEQSISQYDQNGNVTLTTTKQRHHDAVDLGDLISNNARVSFAAAWYDSVNRPYTSINYGNNGSDALTSGSGSTIDPTQPPQVRDSSASNGGDILLRTDVNYDKSGYAALTESPRKNPDDLPHGIKSRNYFDALGRLTGTTDAYTGSVLQDDQTVEPQPGVDTDRQSRYEYNELGEKTKEISLTYNPANPGVAKSQNTQWFYGISKGSKFAVNNNGLLNKVTYGIVADDPSELLPPIAGFPAEDAETITGYNALGQVTEEVLRNGTTHNMKYDAIGRQTSDKSTSSASFSTTFIDGWADERQQAYDALGRGTLFTMLKAGAIVNQVQRIYDGLGNLVTEYQAHSGSVVTSVMPKVQYTYDTNYGVNRSRLTRMMNPDGTSVSYEYTYAGRANDPVGTLASLNDHISRVGAENDGTNTGGTNRVETYDYMGLNTLVARSYQNVKAIGFTPDVALSYLHDDIVVWYPQPDDAGTNDPYDGLDRFGRVSIQNWTSFGDSRVYSYDAGNDILAARIGDGSIYSQWRSEVYNANPTNTGNIDAWHAYDKLGRDKGFGRGVLQSDGLTVQQSNIVADAGPPPVYVDTKYLRVTNEQWNPSTNHAGDYRPTSSSGEEGTQPAQIFQKQRPSTSQVFDLGGPLFNTGRRDIFLTYDAWGRLTSQSAASLKYTGTGNNFTYSRPFDNLYRYDALGRRISEAETHSDDDAHTNGASVDLFYNASGSVVQESRTTNGGSPAVTRYILSAASPGMIVLRDDVDHFDSDRPRRVWSMQGPDGSAWSLYKDNSRGSQDVERVLYSTSGLATFQSPRSVNVNAPSGYSFTDVGDYGWRFLYKGGRLELDRDTSLYGTSIVDRQSGLMWVNGSEYDSSSGRALIQDKYAFFRPGTVGSGVHIDANAYSPRGGLNALTRFAGSEPTWDDAFWAALGGNGVAARLGSNIANDWGLNFIGAAFGNFAESVGGIASSIFHPIRTYNAVVDQTASFMSREMIAGGGDSTKGFWNRAWSFTQGAGYVVGSATGLKDLGEAAYGVDLASGDSLSSVDRWSRGFAGFGNLALGVAGGIKGYDPSLASFRPGGQGFASVRNWLGGGQAAEGRISSAMSLTDMIIQDTCFIPGTEIMMVDAPQRAAVEATWSHDCEHAAALLLICAGPVGWYLMARGRERRLKRKWGIEQIGLRPSEFPWHRRSTRPQLLPPKATSTFRGVFCDKLLTGN